MEPISPNISFKEATFSLTAIRLGIDNTPNDDQLKNMKALAENVFEPLRAHFNVPIHISSFFRCVKLNASVGGAINSQHQALNGAAIDIDNESPSNEEIFNFIKDHLEFDQVIKEFPNSNNIPSWIHVSYNKDNNRRNILVSEKINGITIYNHGTNKR
jgi:hypothetical protein